MHKIEIFDFEVSIINLTKLQQQIVFVTFMTALIMRIIFKKNLNLAYSIKKIIKHAIVEN